MSFDKVVAIALAFALGFAVYGLNLLISSMVVAKKAPYLIGITVTAMVALNLFGFRLATLDTAALIAIALGAGCGAATGYGLLRRARGP